MGFTTVELMTTIAILSVFAVLAASSMGDLVQHNRLQASGDKFVLMLQAARGEAIKRATPVLVTPLSATPDASNEWGEGVRIWMDLDGDNNFDSGEQLLQFDALSNIKVDASPNFTALNFRPSGRVGAVGGNTTYTFNLCAAGRAEGATFMLSTANLKIKRSDKSDCPIT